MFAHNTHTHAQKSRKSSVLHVNTPLPHTRTHIASEYPGVEVQVDTMANKNSPPVTQRKAPGFRSNNIV